MKERIFNNWTIIRVLYLVMGIMVIIFAISEKQWIGILPGSLFAIMALFNTGCTGGTCMPDTRKRTYGEYKNLDTSFEEVK